MKYILPRVILGNRGDLASRWGLLRILKSFGVKHVTVFHHAKKDVPDITYQYLTYRPFKNILLNRSSYNVIRKSDTVLWAVGLDIQDDSSMVRIIYLIITFLFYRILGLRIWILFQGAGPLNNPLSRILARLALAQVEIFVARDPGTYKLIGEISPNTQRILAHDAIFFPGFEDELKNNSKEEQAWLSSIILKKKNQPIIGINIRQWFHFASSLLPYELARKKYLKRSEAKMERLISAMVMLIEMLRQKQNARIILISAYQPGIIPWEDDQPWLARIKTCFKDDSQVQLINASLDLPLYYALMSRLDIMIGMRLHSTLIAMRYGVPSINISYTLKGHDIMNHLGIPENVIDLQQFLLEPQKVYKRVASILMNRDKEVQKIQKAVQKAIENNISVIESLFQKSTN